MYHGPLDMKDKKGKAELALSCTVTLPRQEIELLNREVEKWDRESMTKAAEVQQLRLELQRYISEVNIIGTVLSRGKEKRGAPTPSSLLGYAHSELCHLSVPIFKSNGVVF